MVQVLVVGAGQSAAEIAIEISGVAERTFLLIRRAVHVVPRRIGSRPYDARDVEPLNRLPWDVPNRVFARRVAKEIGPSPASWSVPTCRLLEGVPIISSELLPAVRRRQIEVKPAIRRFLSESVRLADASVEAIDLVVFATGYRRIVSPDNNRLFFAGFVYAPGGLLPVVEAQGDWIAEVLAGSARLCDLARRAALPRLPSGLERRLAFEQRRPSQ